MGYNILGEKITKQIKQVKEERQYLETIRKELISKQYDGKVYYISFITVKNLSFTEFMLLNTFCFTVIV